jgi:hypothetical protein
LVGGRVAVEVRHGDQVQVVQDAVHTDTTPCQCSDTWCWRGATPNRRTNPARRTTTRRTWPT